MPVANDNSPDAGLFYRLGQAAGRRLRRGRWVWRSLTGGEADALRAERDVGRDLATAFRRQFPLARRPETRRALDEIGARLAGRLRDRRRTFVFSLVAAEAPNAFALPGGFVFVTSGMLDLLGPDRDEAAFLLAHEMAHVVHKDAIERVKTETAVSMALRALPVGGGAMRWARSAGARLLRSAYSRKREDAADRFALRLARAAGFDPRAGAELLRRLAAANGSGSGMLGEYFSTHPPLETRARRLDELARTGNRGR